MQGRSHTAASENFNRGRDTPKTATPALAAPLKRRLAAIGKHAAEPIPVHRAPKSGPVSP